MTYLRKQPYDEKDFPEFATAAKGAGAGGVAGAVLGAGVGFGARAGRRRWSFRRKSPRRDGQGPGWGHRGLYA